MNRKYTASIFCIISLFLWLTSLNLHAKTISIDSTLTHKEIGTDLIVLEDPAQKLTIHNMKSPTISARQIASQTRTPMYGYTTSTLWTTFTLKNTDAIAMTVYIDIENANMDYVEFYYRDASASELWKKLVNGRRHPFAIRKIANENPIFALHLPAHSTIECFLRFQNTDYMVFPISLWSPSAYAHKDRLYQIFFGCFYGILLAISLYSLCLFFILKERMYLYYLLYLLSYLFFQLDMNMILFEYAWPTHPNFNIIFSHLMAVSTTFWILAFTKQFLSITREKPVLNGLYHLMLIVTALMGIGAFVLPYSIWMSWVMILASIAAMMIMGSAIFLWRQGYRPARFLLMAQSTLLIGVIISTIRSFGWKVHHPIIIYSIQIGVMLDAILLALALADRIQIMKKEKDEADRNALVASEERAELLEKWADHLSMALENTGQDLQEFMSWMAHDVKNQLVGLTRYMRNQLSPTLQETDWYKMIYDNIEKIRNQSRNLITDYHDRQRTHVNDIIDQICRSLQPLIQSKSIQLSITHKTTAFVTSHPKQIEWLFQNIIENAIQYSYPNGRIEITISDSGKNFIVTVKDQGIGLSAQHQGKIFEKGFRIHDPQKEDITRDMSTGLGLHICDTIAHRLGGKITVHSQPCKGSTFIISLPKLLP